MGGGDTDLTAVLPRPTLDGGRCTRRYDSGCAACVSACPRGALVVGDRHGTPTVDPVACIACGLCVVACPASAVSGVGASPAEVVRAAGEADGDLVVGCRMAARGPGASAVGVGCLAALDPEVLAAAAATLQQASSDAPQGIVLQRATCEACPVAQVERVATVLRTGARLAAAVAPGVAVRDEVVGAASGGAPAPRTGRRFGRRALVAPRPVVERSDATPRTLLLAVAPDAPLPALQVSAACTACGACSKVCPTGALTWRQRPGASTLDADPTACVGCGECARVCAEDAIRVVGRRPGPHRRTELVTVGRPRCTRCELVLEPGRTGLCARCAARRGLVADVWRNT